MNKLIFLDGPYGIGKTTVADCICEISKEKYICIDPDEYFNNDVKRYFLWGWPIPCNKAILREIQRNVEEKIKECNIVIPLTLNSSKYKNDWVHSFNDLAELHHIVLIADRKTILNRIRDDVQRDKSLAMEQLDDNWRYYQRDIEGTIKIDTSEMAPQVVASKVLEVV